VRARPFMTRATFTTLCVLANRHILASRSKSGFFVPGRTMAWPWVRNAPLQRQRLHDLNFQAVDTGFFGHLCCGRNFGAAGWQQSYPPVRNILPAREAGPALKPHSWGLYIPCFGHVEIHRPQVKNAGT
jgi:hypothetical protein